jgi:RNA polymerase sigma factor (sigma-70 family)
MSSDPNGDQSPNRPPWRTGHRIAPRPFEEVITEHGATVMRVCRSMLAAADAEDAWVDTFVSAMRAYPDLAPDSNVRGWLVTIAHNRAIDHLRAAGRRPIPTDRLPDRTGASSVVNDLAEPHDGLRAALETLAPKQRSAVVYRYLGDLSYAAIAELMGTSQAAARRNASDGIAALRHELSRSAP